LRAPDDNHRSLVHTPAVPLPAAGAGDQRRVPQVMLTYAGEHMRIGGARELRMSGVQSLFGPARSGESDDEG
jgi:hypothetical protein